MYIDYITYGDTDSLYIHMDNFCKNRFGEELWLSKSDDEKIDILNEISECVKNYVNRRVYNEIQIGTYNSTEGNLKIHFEKEKIIKSGLFVAKKNYVTQALWVEGEKKEKISVTGLSIVRGDSSEAIRYRLKDVMYMILRNEPDEQIIDRISQYKKELMNVYPEEIAANIGVSHIDKWIVNDKPIKGTPWHVKGVANYHMILKTLGLENIYENIYEGIKAKVVYVKPNKFGAETITFHRWPKEFKDIMDIDMVKMIDKFFIKKLKILLEPMGKVSILSADMENTVKLFFT